MSKRREFSKPVMVEIIKRATREGQTYCESCGVLTRHWHIDHIIPDGLYIDKSAPLTAADGQLLCAGYRETCHGKKTAERDVPTIAKAKRREAAHLGINNKTALSGRTREEKRAARDAKSAGRMPLPPRRLPPGFESATNAGER